MKIRIVAPVMNLNIDIDTIDLGNVGLTKDKAIFDHINSDKKFVEKVGTIYMETVKNNFFFYFEGDYTLLTPLKTLTPHQILVVLNTNFRRIIDSFWFIKDNRISLLTTTLFQFDNGETTQLTNNSTFSRSDGEATNHPFTVEEISNGGLIHKKVTDIKKDFEYSLIKPSEIELQLNEVVPYIFNDIPYNMNRFYRAILFLERSRAEAALIVKITYNIAICECLLSSSASEVTHQVSERVAFFLGGDSEAKQSNYNLIKAAYSIRSRYIHGDVIKDASDKIKAISKNLDDLLRELFLKVIAEPEIFLLPNTEGNKNIFEAYWKNLIFQ